ncbi:MAG: hypothetical protein HY426_04340 [Candidatus Levybacteria bacterium]|nr:hypothetical protein [Candidatus Levybacteria bacterium]
MSIDDLTDVVTYNLRGPAGSNQEINIAELRGVNEVAPRLALQTVFGKMSGSKTQDVQVTLPNGVNAQVLGMVKTKRYAGQTRYMTIESATYSAVDSSGKIFCGAKIRLDFNRNLFQYANPELRDFQSLWYYDIPCSQDGNDVKLALGNSKLRALVLNEVWQARIAWGSFFFNWGHSVTSIGGIASTLPGGWWTHLDVPNTSSDSIGAVNIVNDMVKDLESSPSPWLEYAPGGTFDVSGAYLIYSAGDADKYATWDRVLLDRQTEYAVFYRPDKATPWDYITIKPIYNFEWNDIGQVLASFRGWGTDPFSGKLNEEGLPKDEKDSVIAEMERVGWMNAPNSSLEQIQYLGSDGRILYAMTVRAFIGAADSLIIFGNAKPDLGQVREDAPIVDDQPKPVLYDDKGNPLPREQQPYTDQQWAEFQREATIWNYLKDNPSSVGADLLTQYRFSDNSSWAPIPCGGDSGGTCGYRPIEWNLSASYYFDGQVRKPWLVSQLLGEVGVRTLGMSYASGRYEGTGMLFGMSQKLFQEEYYSGFSQESIWRLDARASQLPDTLAESWAQLHQ